MQYRSIPGDLKKKPASKLKTCSFESWKGMMKEIGIDGSAILSSTRTLSPKNASKR